MNDELKDLFDNMQKQISEIKLSDEVEFPLTIDGIDIQKPQSISWEKPGSLVQVRPCAEEYEKETFLGIYLGDLALHPICFLNMKENRLKIAMHCNPAIFVPDLSKIIWGCESWWGPIESEEQLKQITDDDIQNIWYVKALKKLAEKE